MDITNTSGSDIVINRVFAYWVKAPQTQALEKLFLNSIEIWNESDSTSPSDIQNWINSALTIPDTATRTFVVQFEDDLQPGDYEIHIVFHTNCRGLLEHNEP
jgi:hypothetical protein